MKTAFFMFILSTSVHAGLSNCGEYTLKGVVRPLEHGLTVVVNEKTQSEMQITTTILESSKLGAFVNKPVTIKALLDKKFDGTKGVASKIIQAEFRLPDPLNPTDTGAILDKKTTCAKE